MPIYAHVYLMGSLFWLGVWAVLFGLLKNQRREMLWTGFCLAPAGPVSEFWSLQDYWHPAFVYEFRWGAWRFGGVEDYLLCFALAGISAGVFEYVVVRRGWTRIPSVSWGSLWRLTVWPALGLFLFMVGSVLGLRSIHTLFLSVLLTTAAMLRRGAELWRTLLLLSAGAALAYGAFYVWIFIPLFPDSSAAMWKLENTWGIQRGGVPLEELVWAGLTMLFAGPYLRASLTKPGGGNDSAGT